MNNSLAPIAYASLIFCAGLIAFAIGVVILTKPARIDSRLEPLPAFRWEAPGENP